MTFGLGNDHKLEKLLILSLIPLVSLMYKEHPLLNAAFVWFRATFMARFGNELTIN